MTADELLAALRGSKTDLGPIRRDDAAGPATQSCGARRRCARMAGARATDLGNGVYLARRARQERRASLRRRVEGAASRGRLVPFGRWPGASRAWYSRERATLKNLTLRNCCRFVAKTSIANIANYLRILRSNLGIGNAYQPACIIGSSFDVRRRRR